MKPRLYDQRQAMTGQVVTVLVREDQTFSPSPRHAQICHEDLHRPELEALASVVIGHASVCITRVKNSFGMLCIHESRHILPHLQREDEVVFSYSSF